MSHDKNFKTIPTNFIEEFLIFYHVVYNGEKLTK